MGQTAKGHHLMATFDYHALTYKGCHPPLYAGDPCRDIAGEPIGGHAEAMYFVYLMASQKNGTLYCGVTNDLMRRAYEHREGLVEGFTESHGVKRLVWFILMTALSTPYVAKSVSKIIHASGRSI